jgi:hypothetical protein
VASGGRTGVDLGRQPSQMASRLNHLRSHRQPSERPQAASPICLWELSIRPFTLIVFSFHEEGNICQGVLRALKVPEDWLNFRSFALR